MIDDKPQTPAFPGHALGAAGYAALRAETAREGLCLAAARGQACVLLDLGLPDMGGKEALARLRAFSPENSSGLTGMVQPVERP